MIKSFADRETRSIWDGVGSQRLAHDMQPAALKKLRMLNRAQSLTDLMNPPGNRLERLKGDRAGQYSIRINQQWRVCFQWSDGHAYAVEVVDYHA
ncbi:MAG: type II toxin-antitoxin system RelE/ParE family toxin [Rhodospirillaceae bacterium]|nr:type II toxin-antitoxin system RelE/ParE family toxin [Rhodospirillaceae bacterium]